MNFISQHVDYTGTLYANLRDLEGKDTLAFELIQNADDVSTADWIRFDVRDDALIVKNNGRFTDCDDVEAPECPFEKAEGVKCDFHRFRKIAGRGKRREENTTGAFGIGFISVYQITDQPEVRSGHRHWILHPDAPEPNRRIEQQVLSEEIQGTEFYLPWARDENSALRKALDMSAVSSSYPDNLAEHLCENLPASLLFLRNLSKIEIFRNGASVLTVRRTRDDDITRIIQETEVDETTATYLTKERRFDEHAERLLSCNGTNNQEKKDADARIAIPLDRSFEDQWTGWYYAYLPTRHSTDLPFHIQGDFFPSSDRRRIVFDGEFRSQWNRLVTRQAHQAFAESLPRLRSVLSPYDLWSVLEGVYTAGHGDGETAKGCWQKIKPTLEKQKYIYTAVGDWKQASDTYLFPKDHRLSASTRKALSLETHDTKLRRHHNLMKAIGANDLTFSKLVERIEASDLTHGIDLNEAPAWIREEDRFNEVCRLLQKKYSTLGKREKEYRIRLQQLPLAKTADGKLKAFSKVKRTDPEILKPLKHLNSDVAFLTPELPGGAQSLIEEASLVDQLTITDVFDILRDLSESTLNQQWKQSSGPLVRILRRLVEKISEIDKSNRESLKNTLHQLPIWPSGVGYQGLDNVVIPGGYEDPLGLSRVLGPDAVKAVGRELEENLGVQRLSFKRYVTEHLPQAFAEQDVDRATRHRLVVSLSREIGKLQAIDGAHDALSTCPIVLCKDGSYRQPNEVYFEDGKVQKLFGEGVEYVSNDLPHNATGDLYELIGVASTPRPEDIIHYIKQLIDAPPSGSARERIQNVIHYLGKHFNEDLSPFENLKNIAWLPVEKDEDRWHKPSSVYAPEKKELFASQAEFIDVRNRTVALPVLSFLSVKTEPSVEQVVEHLLYCTRKGTPPDNPQQIYEALSSELERNGPDAKRQVQRLRNKKTLYVRGVGFCRPDHVFRLQHPFGPFRYRLSNVTGGYEKFLDTVGVKSDYGSEDAVGVLLDIADEHGSSQEIDEDVRPIVLNCWKICEDLGLNKEHIQQLKKGNVVLSKEGLLIRPEEAYFHDHPNLPSRIKKFLKGNLVQPDPAITSALGKAGVRSIRKVLRTRLAEAPEAAPDQSVSTRIKNRISLIRRILAERSDDGDTLSEVSIGNIETFRSPHLSVITEAAVLGEKITSEPKTVAAFLDDATGRLYVTDAGSQAWLAVCREIALLLAPTREPASLASDLTHALQPKSLQEAKQRLDALGFVHIEEHQHKPIREQPPISLEQDEEGGEDESNKDDNRLRGEADGFDIEERHSSSDTEGESHVQPSDEMEREATDSGTPPDEVSQDDSLKPSPDTIPIPSAEDEADLSRSSRDSSVHRGSSSEEKSEDEKQVLRGDYTSGGDEEPSSVEPPAHTRRKSKLRSYVISTGNEDELSDTAATGPSPSLSSGSREKINRSGIEFVLNRERAEGRVPEEQDHFNPGYDICSRDEHGNTVRFIEVKSTNGPWDGFGIGLSSTQFNMAQEKKEMYWLYVVERVASDNPKLHRIQHPVQHIDEYRLDDEWAKIAEGTS